jgi:hypothetical protein
MRITATLEKQGATYSNETAILRFASYPPGRRTPDKGNAMVACSLKRFKGYDFTDA